MEGRVKQKAINLLQRFVASILVMLVGGRKPRPRLGRYGIALIAVGVAFIVRYLLEPVLHYDAPFILFVPAIIVAGVLGGLGPSILASIASVGLASGFFISSRRHWAPNNVDDIMAAVIFVFTSVVVAALTSAIVTRTADLQKEIDDRKEVENQLHQSEKRFRKIFESAAVGLLQTDSDGRCITANPKFCAITGYTIEELLQLNIGGLTFPADREAEAVLMRKGLSGELPSYQNQKRYLRKNGSIIWVRTTTSFLHDAEGKPKSPITIVEDITAHKEAEEALLKSQAKLQDIVDHSSAMIFVKDLAGRYLLSNSEFEKITHKPSREIVGKTDHNIFPEAQADTFRANDLNVLQTGRASEFEETALHDDGPHISIVHKFPMRDHTGQIYATGGIVTDITKRKHAEEALHRAQKGYADLVRTIDGIVWEAVPDTLKFSFVSERAERLLLYPLDRWLNEPNFWEDHLHPKDREWAVEFCRNATKEKRDHDFEYRMISADGRTIWLRDIVNVTVDPDGTIRLRGVMVDISEQKKAEEALRHSEEQLRLTTEGANADLWNWDIANDLLECPSIHEPFGFAGPIKLATYLEHVYEDDRGPLMAEVQDCIRTHREFNFEFRVVFPNGSIGWRHSRGRPRYVDGRAICFSGMSLDVTARKHAEELLRRSEERLRNTTEGARIGLWDWDIRDNSIHWNPFEYHQFGVPLDTPITFEIFMNGIHPDDRSRMIAEVQRCLRENKPLNIEHRIQLKDGTIRWNQCKGSPIYSHNKPVRFSGMSLDITKRKNAEQALEEARKALAAHAAQLEERVNQRTVELKQSLRDMETFCYTIAHDLSAPLRFLRGFSVALLEDYSKELDATAKAYCERIHQSATHMEQLIFDLLAFGRLSHRELPTTTVDLTEEFEKVLAQSTPEIEERHAEIVLDQPLSRVSADAPVLDHVLQNLISNAMKFVPPERKPHVHIYAETRDDVVRVWVEDNGIGIAPEHQGRIFDPFERLHTKEAYPGTGMGLAIVQRGIEKMGGHVGVESHVGEGSRFWIELPVSHEAA